MSGDPMQLAGRFFLLPDHLGGWQGQFLTDCDGSVAEVQLYSWLTGAPTCKKLMPMSSILEADIFDTHAEWIRAAEGPSDENHPSEPVF